MNKNFNLDEIISAINEVNNKNYSFPVFIPSIQKEVGFKQLTTFQQKNIIKSVMDSRESDVSFISTLYDIIKANCVDQELDIGSLTLFDKLYISLILRGKSIGYTYTINLEYSGSNLSHQINLAELIDKMASVQHPRVGTLSYEGYKIEVGVPTISTELKFEKGLSAKKILDTRKDDITEGEVRSYIGDVFISELAKYVRRLQIPIKDEFMVINMQDLEYDNVITVVEKMPTAVLEGILKYIETVNESIGKITTLQVPVGVSEETKQVEYQEATLEINSDFFILS